MGTSALIFVSFFSICSYQPTIQVLVVVVVGGGGGISLWTPEGLFPPTVFKHAGTSTCLPCLLHFPQSPPTHPPSPPPLRHWTFSVFTSSISHLHAAFKSGEEERREEGCVPVHLQMCGSVRCFKQCCNYSDDTGAKMQELIIIGPGNRISPLRTMFTAFKRHYQLFPETEVVFY